MQWKDVTRLLLVGGSSRMPMVQKILEAESGMKVDRSLSPDEAVAHGAALYAGLLIAKSASSPETKPAMRVRNVSSHDLGVLSKDPTTGRPVNSVIIPRNSVLPITKGKRFRTARKGQKDISINVIEGGDSFRSECNFHWKMLNSGSSTGTSCGNLRRSLFYIWGKRSVDGGRPFARIQAKSRADRRTDFRAERRQNAGMGETVEGGTG